MIRGRGRLIIEAPPRHGKSVEVSHWNPIWLLDNLPHKRVILASYGAELAEHFGRNVRNEFATNPNLVTTLREDSKAAGRWNTPQGGGMLCTGVGGAVTGFGGDLVLIDDPLKNWEEAHSAIIRDRTNDWICSTLYSRLEPGATIVLAQQRMNEDDPAGHLIAHHSDKWDVIRLPALAEAGDIMGRAEGEALCPERYSVADLKLTRAAMISAAWDAMYQQSPRQVGGGRVYDQFVPEIHVDRALELRDGLPLHVSLDFNRNPGMHVVIGQQDATADLITATHEIHGPYMKLQPALDALETLIKTPVDQVAIHTSMGEPVMGLGGFRWGSLTIFGDASGTQDRAETTATAYEQVAQWLDRMGWPYGWQVPSGNPPVRDRIDTFNASLRDNDGTIHYKVHPRCERLLADLKWLKTDEQGLIDKRDQKLSHACLVAGTLIATENGDVPIEDVNVGTMVWTRSGLRPVTHAWMSSPAAPVMELKTSSGRSLIGTWNHPIWVENKGFVLMQSVINGMILSCLKTEKLLSMGDESITDIQTRKTEVRGCTFLAIQDKDSDGCTFKSGSTIMVRSPRAITSTIRTKTQQTTRLTTSNCCPAPNIAGFMPASQNTLLRLSHGSPSPEWKQASGTSRLTDELGTESMRRGWLLGSQSSPSRERAFGAENNLSKRASRTSHFSAPVTATPPIAARAALMMKREPAPFAVKNFASTDTKTPSVVPDVVEHVSAVVGKRAVYDLTVADAHEFYANGILVSNSDAEGYRLFQLRPIPGQLEFIAGSAQVIQPGRY